MLNTEQEKEILDYIKEQRSEIDQIAKFMWNNTESQCLFGKDMNLGICRAVGVVSSKGQDIIGELISLYKKIYGADYEVKTKPHDG